MNLKLLCVIPLLFLQVGCARFVKDASPASDLDVLIANVTKDGKPVLLPNAKEYCAELARTEQQQDECMGDLEDALYNANRRGERQIETVRKFVARERLRRNPCSVWERMFRVDRCRPDKNSATPR